ncbi:PspC domain-containing protein [Nakamurella sp. YIM 132087]|uniref:PspC domain-containing protein n=2 Tax=Nakamurella alba TaxID=2665158 RepID=A0A7K1FJK7_9ACTN|nr:PspC domain-containing protein [Nakamurella alba]
MTVPGSDPSGPDAAGPVDGQRRPHRPAGPGVPDATDAIAPDITPSAGALPPLPTDPTTPDGIPKLFRSRDGAVIGGVAGGLSTHLKVPVGWVRVVFALMAVMGGAGVLAYALLWIFVPQRPATSAAAPERSSRNDRRQALGIGAVGLALMIAATALGLGQVLGWVLGPLGLAAVGAALIWREADDARRAKWRRTAVGIVGPGGSGWWRLIGGCLLVVGGLSVFALGQLDFTAVRSALIAVLLTLIGVAVITIPWWVRLVRDLGTERQGRIRERERAEIAAHLHDSVLQTLALIQRQAADPREVQRLARGQERELRTWLYGPAGYASPGAEPAAPDTTFAAALALAAGEVEDTYAVAVAPVVVGDTGMDQHLAALVAAAREAMVNAAKHAEVTDISVYAEIEDGTASVFVRDRGAGFDPEAVGADRRGLAESVRGRMERHGGRAVVRSSPGAGTEIELSMPVSRVPGAEPAGDEQPAAREGAR